MILKLAAIGYSDKDPIHGAPWDRLSPVAWKLRNDFFDLFVGRPAVDINESFTAGKLTFSFFEGKIIGEWTGDPLALDHPTTEKDSK